MKLIISILLLLFHFTLSQGAGELTIKVSNIDPIKGEVYIAVYNNSKDYMDIDAAAFRKIVPVTAETETIVIGGIPEGEYAIAVFQDINGNGELDTRGAGIPKEPFGFSNDARGKFGPPKYKRAQFSFSGSMEINIKLVNNANK